MAAPDEPVRIDPERLDRHHEGTLTKLIGARFVEATKDRLVAELTVRDDLTTVGGRVRGGTRLTATTRRVEAPV
jgi:acyl-coenzyme A thioesterase PaaI-like protein